MQFGLTRRRGAPSRGAFEGMHGFRAALDTLQAWLCRGRGDRANSVSSSKLCVVEAGLSIKPVRCAHRHCAHRHCAHRRCTTGHRAHRIAIRGHSSGSNDRISFIAHGSVGALLLTDLVGAPMDRSTDQPGLGSFLRSTPSVAKSCTAGSDSPSPVTPRHGVSSFRRVRHKYSWPGSTSHLACGDDADAAGAEFRERRFIRQGVENETSHGIQREHLVTRHRSDLFHAPEHVGFRSTG